MAIGTLAAVGLGLAGAGQVLGASSASKASKKSANIAAATADKNNAFAGQIYDKNAANLSTYMNAGAPASSALNSFLGLTPQQAAPQTQLQPNAMSQFQPQGMIYEGMDGAQGSYQPEVANPFGNMGWNGQQNPGSQMSLSGQQQQPMTSGRDAFRTFLDNSDYGFQFQQGANRVNSGYAGAGTVQSGAAMKGIEDYRQNLQAGYRGEFTNLLGNQQGVGLAGASALAGVGQNFVNTISANNNSAGTAAANAALVKGQNNPFANALSLVGGGLFGARG